MKLTLLGDSIRLIGYGKKVPELLGDFEIFQPAENCRFAKYTLRGLYDWREGMKNSDVIHFNVGLWDTCELFGDGEPFTDLCEYISNLTRIAKNLLKITPNVIFATTTPVLPDKADNNNERIKEYNAAAIRALTPLGIKINDLFSAVNSDLERYIRADDKIHLTDDGIDLCADLVVKSVKEILNLN